MWSVASVTADQFSILRNPYAELHVQPKSNICGRLTPAKNAHQTKSIPPLLRYAISVLLTAHLAPLQIMLALPFNAYHAQAALS
jgi:hypothetical protein